MRIKIENFRRGTACAQMRFGPAEHKIARAATCVQRDLRRQCRQAAFDKVRREQQAALRGQAATGICHKCRHFVRCFGKACLGQDGQRRLMKGLKLTLGQKAQAATDSCQFGTGGLRAGVPVGLAATATALPW